MRRFAFIPVCVLLSFAGMAAGRTSDTASLVNALVSEYPFETGLVGVQAITASGDTIVDYNGGTNMVPASNVKIVTCALALSVLGPEYRFRTRLAYSGEIKNGILTGNVYIIGGGDPTTVAKQEQKDSLFSIWAEMLRNAGIRRIQGDIIGDGSFISCSGDDSRSVYDVSRSYGATPSGLNFFENSQTFLMIPSKRAGESVSYSVKFPDTPWMEYRNSSVSSATKQAGGISYADTPLAPVAEFSGSCWCGRGKFELTASNWFPELTCAWYFNKYLNEHGIPVNGYSEGGAAGISLNELGCTLSDSLKTIVRHAMYESDNFYAEALFRMLGKHRLGSSCADSCRIVVNDCLAAMPVSPRMGYNIVDGSGLSRKNFASPAFFVSFLDRYRRCGNFADFLECLPHPGEGTLKKRLPDADDTLRNRIYMKSGSMAATMCFSGYILPSDGNPDNVISFSILTNNIGNSSRATAAGIDRILTSLALEK